MRVLLIIIAFSIGAFAQSCPPANQSDDAPKASTLHGQIIYHHDLRKWIGFKLDQKTCGEDEIQLIFNRDASYSRATSLNGCTVDLTGTIYHGMTGHYAATLAIGDPKIEPSKTCRLSPPAKPPITEMKIPDSVAKKILPLLDAQQKGPSNPQLEAIFASTIQQLSGSKDPASDEALVVLMCFYVGESQEEVDAVIARGKRMIPLLRKYIYAKPKFRNRSYPDDMLKHEVERWESFQGAYDAINKGQKGTWDNPEG